MKYRPINLIFNYDLNKAVYSYSLPQQLSMLAFKNFFIYIYKILKTDQTINEHSTTQLFSEENNAKDQNDLIIEINNFL